MITQEQQKQSAELIQTLAQKAWESSNFKEQLISNPVATIESVTGQKIQSDAKFVVEDQTDESIIYLNIPRILDFDGIELTEEQLELVAGGWTPLAYFAGVAVVDGLAAIGLGVGIYAAVK
jgi:hypothetical protein